MNQLRMMTRFALLVVLVMTGTFAAPLGGSAVAQGTTSYVSPMTGIPIETSGPWTIDTETVLSEGGVESVTVMGEFEFMQVWFMPGDVDLVEARDVILDSFATTFGSFVTIDRGAYGDVSYSLDMTSSEGIEFGVFSLFLGQRSSGFVEYYVYFGAVPMFASGFASAQQNVRVGGNAVFDGVDGAGLQNFLVENAGATGASQSGTTTAPPTPAPTEEVQTGTQPTEVATGGTTADGEAYLAALEAELDYVDGTAFDFQTSFLLLESDPETALQQMDAIATEWGGYSDRAALIVAPAGFESLDAEYRALADEVVAISGLWQDLLEAAANEDEDFGLLLSGIFLRVTGLSSMTESIRTTMEGGQTGTTEAPTDVAAPTEAPAPTEVAAPTEASAPTQEPQTGSGEAGDGEAYVQTITGEISDMRGSFDDFQTGLELAISDDVDDQDVGIDQLDEVLTFWSSYPDVAASIVAPAGYEDVDTAYQDVAAQFPGLVITFMEALEAEDAATRDQLLDDFEQQMIDVQDDIDALELMLGGEVSPDETPVTIEEDDVPDDTDLEEDLDESETGARGRIPEQDDDEADEGGSSRSRDRSRTSDTEDLGLVSDGEYVSPQFDIDVVWDDRWEYDETIVDEPIGSDADGEVDWITLAWLGGGMGDVTITIGSDPGFEPGIIVDYWESDEYIDQLPAGAEVVLVDSGRTRGAVMILIEDRSNSLVIYREAACLDRGCEDYALVTIFTTVEDAADIIADAEEGVDVAGEGATDVFSTREITTALDQ